MRVLWQHFLHASALFQCSAGFSLHLTVYFLLAAYEHGRTLPHAGECYMVMHAAKPQYSDDRLMANGQHLLRVPVRMRISDMACGQNEKLYLVSGRIKLGFDNRIVVNIFIFLVVFKGFFFLLLHIQMFCTSFAYCHSGSFSLAMFNLAGDVTTATTTTTTTTTTKKKTDIPKDECDSAA